MTGLIERLQRDSVDPKVAVTTLLRQVKLAAVKLKLGDVEAWVDSELNGYRDDVPDYRNVVGQPKAWNPFNGWIPISFRTRPDLTAKLSRRAVVQSIAELESVLAEDIAGAGGVLQVPFSAAEIHALNKGMAVPFQEMGLIVSRSTLVGILEAVRNRVLEWALNLERAGIMGEGVNFSREEQERAHQHVALHVGSITNFTGNLGVGNASGAISSSVDTAAVRSLIMQVRAYASDLAQAGIDRAVLERQVASLEAALATGDDRAIQGRLSDLRAVVTGAAGNLAASGVLGLINAIVGL
jgi:hypothetical protein